MNATKPVIPTPPSHPSCTFRLLETSCAIHTIAIRLHAEENYTRPDLCAVARQIAILTEHVLALAAKEGCIERVALSLRLSE